MTPIAHAPTFIDPMKAILFIFALLIAASNCLNAQQLYLYPAPEAAEMAPEFALEINGQPVFVYNTRCAAFATFSFEGRIELKVTFASPIYNFDIRPKSRNIQGMQYRNQIRFTLEKPENLSIEINQNLKRPLFIFANPIETEIPDRKDKHVIFFEKGKIHTPGEVLVKSNQTVYIEGGALVHGNFKTNGGRNIRFMGRGIIDNRLSAKGEVRPIEINQCENVLVEGLVLTENRSWSAPCFASKKVTYNNLKIVSSNDWDDGIDIVGSQQVLVNNCFIQSKDDCIAIKAGVDYFTNFSSDIRVDSILVQNSVFWNGVWGNALEIGFETRTDTIQNVTFRNCDIIHVEGPEGTFTIHNGDRALIRNVLYEDIRVEDAQGWLIDFKILFSQYSKDKIRGKIENVSFRNISVEGDHRPSSQILGFSDDFGIKNVVLENFRLHGVKVTSTYNGHLTTIHTTGLSFK